MTDRKKKIEDAPEGFSMITLEEGGSSLWPLVILIWLTAAGHWIVTAL